MKNRNCKIVVSKKEYQCDCCNKKINIGEKYLRLNIKNSGIFHFCNNCKDEEDFIEAKINNPEISYHEYEDWMIESLAFDTSSSNGY